MNTAPAERYFELDITYACSARCRHCIFSSSPKKGGLMTAENAGRYLAEIQKLGYTGRDVIITGGEALLFHDRVLEIAREAGSLGMLPIKSVQSNASWCTNDETTKAKLSELRDAGLEGIYFSSDAYHREYVPIEKVGRAVRIADEIFGEEYVAVTGTRDQLNSDDQPTVEDYFVDGSASRIHIVARATRTLAPRLETIPLDEILDMNCRGGSRDLDPSTVWQINIDAYGIVSSWLCPGIALGNANKTPLSEIVSRPLDKQPKIVQNLVANGPKALLSLAGPHGYKPVDTYVSKCHFCWDVRESIFRTYPDMFAPTELYLD